MEREFSYGHFESAKSKKKKPSSAFQEVTFDFNDENSSPNSSLVKKMKEDLKKEKEIIKEKEKKQKQQEKLRAKQAKKAAKIRRPIGVKLILITSFLVITALGGVTLLVSYFITQDIRTNAEDNNLAINSRTASDTENRINSLTSAVGTFIDLMHTAGDNKTELKNLENVFYSHNKAISAMYFPDTNRVFVNTQFFISRELNPDSAKTYFYQETESIDSAKNGAFELQNASMYFKIPMMAVTYPLNSNGKDSVVAVLYSTEELCDSFTSGSVNKSFFINNKGQIIVHNDYELMMSAQDESNNRIVKELKESTVNNRQIRYKDEQGKELIGAFRKLSCGNGAVITTVETAIILEGINATTRRNIYITIAILAISIMIIYFFAQSLSVPLKQLTAIVNEINKGNFNTKLFADLNTHRKDEIGVLAKSTRNEREILNTFSKMTNKGVTQAIIKKEIDFKPHLKDITIFFSDIRGFTAISDGFKNRFGERSAEEIIGFLNDYMSRMVSCITRTGGTVDKFEGDAIMAAWGVLRQNSLDWETLPKTSVTRALKKEEHDKYVEQDALSAITCCMAMRYALMKYNKDAEAFTKKHQNEPLAKYKPHIRIGAGLNSGRATVGFMGSYDKMEYTSIGDAVNFASRTEASNKPCGTDTLITQDTYDILKKKYIRCKENNFTIQPQYKKNEIIVEQIPVEFEVKGKGKQHFYGVVNMPGFNLKQFFANDPLFEIDPDCEKAIGPKGPKTLSEVRLMLGIPEPEFGKVNLDAEENKIQIASS